MLLGQQALVLCCLLNAASPRSGFASTLGPLVFSLAPVITAPEKREGTLDSSGPF